MHKTDELPLGSVARDADVEVRAGQVRLLYQHAPGVYVATLGCATVAALLLWRALPGFQVLTWLACGIALTAVRFSVLHAYRRAAPSDAELERWARYFVAGSVAGGLFWASAVFVLFVPDKAYYAAFVVILIAGMMAGASFSLSVHRPSFHAFMLPVGAAILLRVTTLAGLEDDYQVAMLALAGLVALFLPLVYFHGRNAEANLVKLLQSHRSNRQLSAALGVKLEELEASHRSLEAENRTRMHTEAELRRNEEQLRLFELAIATTSSAIAFTDPGQRDNPVVYVNPAFTRVTGFQPDEALGRNLRFLAPGDEHCEDVQRLRAAMREDAGCALVLHCRRKDGALFWNDMRITPLRDAGGRVVRLVVVQDDVTARVEAEVQLRRTRDELQAVLDNAPALIYTKDLDGRLTMVNRRWQQLFRLSAGQAVGRQASAVFPAPYADAMRAGDLKVIESGRPLQTEQAVPAEKGMVFHLTTKFPLRDAAGRIYGVCGISTDITERKREQALQAMHHRMTRVIAESSTVGDAMRQVLHILCEDTPWDCGVVYLLDVASGALRATETWGETPVKDGAFGDGAAATDAGTGRTAFMERAVRARDPVWLSDVERGAERGGMRAAAAAGLRSTVAMPVFVDSAVVGVLQFFSADRREPERAFLRMARSIGQQLGELARRRAAEEQTRRAEERLELALEGSELALWDWNVATGEIYLSPRWAEMLRQPVVASHTDIHRLTELAHPEDVPRIRQAILAAFKGRSSLYAVTHRVRAADGEWRWVQSTGKVVERDAEGRALRMAGTNADVTGRIAAEEALKQTQEELQAILDNSPAMIYAKDVRGNLLVTNRPALRDVPYELTLHPAARGLHPRDHEVLQSGRSVQSEDRVVEEDGAHTYLSTRFALRHARGEVYGMCAIATDITDSRRVEAALGESEDRFRQFAQSVNVGFWILDAAPRRLAYGNAALRRIFGVEEDADFEERKLALVHAEDREAVRDAYARWVDEPGPERFDTDYRITRPDGAVRWLRDRAVKVCDGEGRVCRLLGITEDVTEHRSGEEELRQTRAFLESIIEHLPITIFVKDAADLRYVRLNRAGENLLGIPRAELLGKCDQDVFRADVAAQYSTDDRRALSERAIVDIPEEPVETRGHGLRYVHTKKIPVPDGSGVPRYILGISEDVTDAKRSSEAISDMNAALAKKAADLAASNEELEAFAYSVSHDLRAPLRHVNGFINLLREHVGEGLDATGQRYLSKIQAASGRMSALIDELLALSRMSRIEMRYARVSVERLIKEIIQELSGQVGDRTIAWVVRELPYVHGDRILLRQAFANLLDNAIKYTGANPQTRIEVGCEDAGGEEVTVYVRDNGVGFDMRYAHKLFGVFQRLHRQEEFPGTGIGLAHVRRIVERHGGRVWAQAARGQGAVFYVALPRGEEK